MLMAPALSSLVAGAVVGASPASGCSSCSASAESRVTLVTQISGRRTRRRGAAPPSANPGRRPRPGRAGWPQALEAEQRQRRDAAPDPAHLSRSPPARVPGCGSGCRPTSDFLDLRVGWADLPAGHCRACADPGSPTAPEALVRDVPVTVALRGLGVSASPGRVRWPARRWRGSWPSWPCCTAPRPAPGPAHRGAGCLAVGPLAAAPAAAARVRRRAPAWAPTRRPGPRGPRS